MIGASSRGPDVKLRIAIWAGVGALVVVLWNLVVVSNLSTIGFALAYVTCPIAALTRHHAISFYEALLINTATYALIGTVVEIVWRHYNQTRSI